MNNLSFSLLSSGFHVKQQRARRSYLYSIGEGACYSTPEKVRASVCAVSVDPAGVKLDADTRADVLAGFLGDLFALEASAR